MTDPRTREEIEQDAREWGEELAYLAGRSLWELERDEEARDEWAMNPDREAREAWNWLHSQ
jgi:hypothetical protein